MNAVIQNAAAQKQIIDELLDASRLIKGKLQLDLRPVDVAAVVKAAIETVTPAADAKSIRIQLVQDLSQACVMADPERLQQVFWNLLSNAVKFTPPHGRIRVSLEPAGSGLEVAVADTGLGIDAAFLPRVFDRFTQNDSSSTRSARGLGLGLAIARQLVELHRGEIRAESPGVGGGSTFTVTFPWASLVTMPVPRPHSATNNGDGSDAELELAGIRVLVVEDDEDGRKLLQTMLEMRGAAVSTASSAREALDVLSTQPIDVLLSDIEMPGTDGYQLIEELRQRPSRHGGSVPAVALTANARPEDQRRALRAGYQLHVAKPVYPPKLVAVIRRLCGTSRRLQSEAERREPSIAT